MRAGMERSVRTDVLHRGGLPKYRSARARAPSHRLTTGSRVVIIYILTAIVLPFLAIWVTGYESAYYKDPDLDLVQILYGTILFAVVLIGAVRFRPSVENRPEASTFVAPFWLPFAVVSSFLAIGFIGFVRGDSQWRYAAEGLSASLNPVSVAFALAPTILNFLLFIEIFMVGPGSRRSAWKNISLRTIICIGLALTASGLGPMLTVLVSVLFLIFPNQIHMLAFKRTGTASIKSDFLVRLGVIPLVVVGSLFLLIAVILGEQIKTGADSAGAIDFYRGMGLEGIANYLVGRFSTSVISLKVALSEYTGVDWSEPLNNLLTPLRTLLFRLDALTGLGFGIARPEPGSLMRINYLMINYYPMNLREGTSAGLLAAMVLAFPLPISLIAAGLYVSFFRGIVNVLSNAMLASPTWIGCFAVHYIISGLLASPPDLLLIVDDGPVMLMLYGGLALSARRQLRRSRE